MNKANRVYNNKFVVLVVFAQISCYTKRCFKYFSSSSKEILQEINLGLETNFKILLSSSPQQQQRVSSVVQFISLSPTLHLQTRSSGVENIYQIDEDGNEENYEYCP